MSLAPLLADTDGSLGLAFGSLFILFIFVFFAILIGLFVFWIVMLVDAFRRKNWPNDDQRTLWLIILVASFFLQMYWLAALIYYFAMKKPLDRGEVPNFFDNQKSTATVVEPKPTKKSTSKK